MNKSSDIIVNNSFNIIKKDNYRVNIIGFKSKDLVDESGIDIELKDFDERFSIDANNSEYRVEFYKNDNFCSMSKVQFKYGK